ncbi:MAG TPA: hypothetical protein PLS90_16705 [Candidatus Sumerlaeota bacterium]|nr:hypothetical protein [Candidatus Sumerlaeota bacterium]
MRSRSNLFVVLMCFLLAGVCPAALVHESDFDEAPGTNPISAGDVTAAWAIDGQFHGIYGWYDYDGDGRFILHHPNHNWDSPWFEIETSGTLDLDNDMELVVNLYPKFDSAGDNQYMEIMLTEAGGDRPNLDCAFQLWQEYNELWVGFGPDGLSYGDSLDLTNDELSSFTAIITYDDSAQVWHAFYRLNGGPLIEAPGSPLFGNRDYTTVKVWAEMDFSPAADELEYELWFEDLSIYDEVSTFPPPGVVKESTFSSTDIFGNPVTNGEFTAMWFRDGTCQPCGGPWAAYSTTGSLKMRMHRFNWDFPWAEYNTAGIIPTDNDMQVEWDFYPHFTSGGSKQIVRFQISDPAPDNTTQPPVDRELVIENTGNNAWAIFPTGSPLYLGKPADEIQVMKVIQTYEDATGQFRGFVSVDNGPLREVPPIAPLDRTKTVVRLKLDQGFPTSNTDYQIHLNNMKISNVITVTEGSQIPIGTPMRNSAFDYFNNGAFVPINDPRDVGGLFFPGANTQAYNGTGQWVITKSTDADFPNATIPTVTTADQSAEVTVRVKPGWTADGVGQNFNFKWLGNPGSVFCSNTNDVLTIMFGASSSARCVVGR